MFRRTLSVILCIPNSYIFRLYRPRILPDLVRLLTEHSVDVWCHTPDCTAPDLSLKQIENLRLLLHSELRVLHHAHSFCDHAPKKSEQCIYGCDSARMYSPFCKDLVCIGLQILLSTDVAAEVRAIE